MIVLTRCVHGDIAMAPFAKNVTPEAVCLSARACSEAQRGAPVKLSLSAPV